MKYECNLCKNSFSNIEHYNLHQYHHRDLLNSRFYCKYPNCKSEFIKYKSFKMHLYRNHGNNVKKDCLTRFQCDEQNCTFVSRLQNSTLTHMYKHIEKNETVGCPYKNCSKKFHLYKTVSALKSHVYRFHYKMCDKSYVTHSQSKVDELYCVNLINHNDNVCVEEVQSVENNIQEQFLKSLAATYLTLHAKFFMTDSGMQRLIDGLSDINNIFISNIRNILQDDPSHVLERIEHEELFKIAHGKENGVLRSPHLRNLYYRKQFRYVAPTKILLGEMFKKDAFFIYIPIIETIQMLLSNKEVYVQLFKEHTYEDDVFTDMRDGDCYKQSEFFSKNATALQIILYQDSFEVCNPLGSSRLIHKVVGIYMMLGNIPPYSRSKMDQIQLVALVLEKHLKHFGFNKILHPIMKDVLHLENDGIEIQNGNIVKGTVLVVIGDNLGSHQVGGFIENFNCNNYFCRYCYAHNWSITSVMNSYPLRTIDNYNHDADIAMVTGEVVHGIKSNSLLNESKYFHVCNPGMPPCIAHDIFEGFLAYDIMLCVQNMCKRKIITYDVLNDRIQKVNFLHERKYEKVPILKKTEKLQGNAMENLQLILVLPFACIEFRNDDDNWLMLDMLRNICTIVMAFKISINQIAYLKYLILEYVQLRCKLFPQVPLKPKHHYLTHYPYLMKKFGPLRQLWTLRYESKHFYFKSILKHSPNFKNILHTMSQRHQLLQALHATQGNLFLDKVSADEAISLNLNNYNQNIANIMKSCTFVHPNFVSTKVTFRGTLYKSGMVLCCRKTEAEDYTLCKIKYIVISAQYNNLFFIGDEMLITYIDRLGIFKQIETNKTPSMLGVYFENLLTHEPLMHYITQQHEQLFHFKSVPFDRFI